MKRKVRTSAAQNDSPKKTSNKNAAEALRRSEEKYRTLFESIDEGFCIIEMIYDETGAGVDYRFVDVNRVFERQTGLENVTGKLGSELMPGTENYWIEHHDRVARTGKPLRFENYHEATGRWYQAYASRVAGTNNQVAIVFDDITERKRREAGQAFLMEIRDDFTHLVLAEEIMQTIGAKIGRFINVPYCHFMAIDEALDEVVYLSRWNADDVSRLPDKVRLSEQITEDFRRLAHRGETVVSNDTGLNPITNAEANAAINALAFITVPFLKNGEWKYQFSVHDTKPREWREDEIELVQELADQVFPRLERARAEESLRESNENITEILESIGDAFYAVDKNWNFTYVNGKAEQTWGKNRENLLGENIWKIFPEAVGSAPYEELQKVFKERQPAQFESFSPVVKHWIQINAYPSKNGGITVYFQDISERRRAKQNEREKEMLEKLVGAQEDERRRIARDLHDELGQQLTALRLKLNALKELCRDDQALCDEIDETQLIAKRIDDGVDFLSWELRPAALDDLGLFAAVQKYVYEWSQYSGVAAEIIGARLKNNRFPREVEINLYRIVQEALNNVNKHAHAKNVGVIMEKRGDSIVLIVEDDGKGFDPEDKTNRSRGIGLIGMQERAILIGGRLTIESAPGGGTTIHVRVPADFDQQAE